MNLMYYIILSLIFNYSKHNTLLKQMEHFKKTFLKIQIFYKLKSYVLNLNLNF